MSVGQRRIPQPLAGVYGNRRNVGTYFHKVVTTTGGTIDTTTSDQSVDSAVTVVKTGSETGRYTFTLPTTHRKLLAVKATITGPTDAAYGAATVGLPAFVRNDLVSTLGTFDIQFVAGDTNWADANVADAAGFMVEVTVAD